MIVRISGPGFALELKSELAQVFLGGGAEPDEAAIILGANINRLLGPATASVQFILTAAELAPFGASIKRH